MAEITDLFLFVAFFICCHISLCVLPITLVRIFAPELRYPCSAYMRWHLVCLRHDEYGTSGSGLW